MELKNAYTELEYKGNRQDILLYKDVNERALERFQSPPFYKITMEKERARQYFFNARLSYDKISMENLEFLQSILKEEVAQFKKSNCESASHIIQVINIQPDDVMFKNGKLEFAYLKVKSSNFDERESISFNRNGFISFGGRSGSKSITRILKGFMKWCDFIKE